MEGYYHLLAIALIVPAVFFFVYHVQTVGEAANLDLLDRTYTSDVVKLWVPPNVETLRGVTLSGRYTGAGTVKTFFVHEEKAYLVHEATQASGETVFASECVETCSLPSFRSKKYLLRIEVDPGMTYILTDLHYSDTPFFREVILTVTKVVGREVQFRVNGTAILDADFVNLLCGDEEINFSGSQNYECDNVSIATFNEPGKHTISFGKERVDVTVG
tara:strand:- start:95 stop:745 length:651 start_codon:yes stop_codon:yes gene_type:complete